MIKIYNSPHFYNYSHFIKNETWASIEDYPYSISNMGRLFSHVKNIIRKPYICQKGYSKIQLFKNCHYKYYAIHRLVAIYFIKNVKNKPQVNHINADKLDNRVENLEWVTNQENRDHMVKLGLHNKGEGVFFSKLTDSDVIEIRKLHELGHKSIEISKKYNVVYNTIWRIVTNRGWNHI